MKHQLLVYLLVITILATTVSAFASGPCLKGTKIQICGTEQQITTNTSDQFDPAISGDIIVYADHRGPDLDVWYYDLATGNEYPVTTALGDQELTDVANGLVVYDDISQTQIYAYDLQSKTTTNISQTPGQASDPATDGTIVVWSDTRDGNFEIYGEDLKSGELRRITNDDAVDLKPMDLKPMVDSAVVTWERCGLSPCDIFTYDWTNKKTQQITATPTDDERNPDISQGRVVYEAVRGGERDICEFDLQSNKETCLSLPGEQVNPKISGDWVSLEDLNTGTSHVRLWHLPTGDVFDLTQVPGGPPAATAQFLSDIDIVPATTTEPTKARFVYTDNRNAPPGCGYLSSQCNLDIYMYEFTWEPVGSAPVFGTLPSPVVEATSPAGAPVRFNVTATIDNGAATVSCTPLSGSTFPLGTTTVSCTATDPTNPSTTSTAQFSVVVRDTTPPALILPPNVTTDAIAPNGAPVNYNVSATDIVDPKPKVVCTPASGSTFAIGTTTVSCSATDFSYNTSSGTFTVLVEAAAQQVNDLIAEVNDMNMKMGIQNSLDAKLQNAEAALNAASAGSKTDVCNLMSAFINQTNAQSGKGLTTEQADELIADANRIRSVLACP